MGGNDWMNKFVMKKLPPYDSVESIDSLGNDYLLIKRKKGVDFKCFCISYEEITHSMIKELLNRTLAIDFIVNIKKRLSDIR